MVMSATQTPFVIRSLGFPSDFAVSSFGIPPRYTPLSRAPPMLILRIRHAETALADGRLDEVFELVRDPKLRSHRRGQDLITKLVNALEKRGREHLKGARFTAALTDCERAQQLAGDLPQLLSLRTEAMD